MKKSIICILILASFLSCSAQKKSKSRPAAVNKTDQLYTEGINQAQAGNYLAAISSFEQVLYLDSNYNDAYLSLAGVYNQIKNYALAAQYYEKGIARDTAKNVLYNLPYSINLAGTGQFQKALKAVNLYLAHPRLGQNSRKAGEYRQRSFAFAVDYEKKHPQKDYAFVPRNLGPNINTADPEYFPSLTIDGKEFVFTRQVNNYNEDFFSSHWEDTAWGPATLLPGDVNTPQNEGAQMISLDGQWLVFTGCSRKDGWGSCDLYISYLTPQGWSEAINLGGRVNSDQWDSQPCLSPDKRDLYFASRRFGGYGGSDLYVCHLLPGGKWSDPENLGPEINTKGDESTPFIHADNQTLYFSSNGLQGYGEDDIFYSRKGPGGAWSIPVNLGYPINTIDKEGSLFIAPDAKTAYYASNRSDSYGALDIYSFELRDNIRPYKTSWVKGKVYDKKTGKGLPSAIELVDIDNKQLLSKVQTDETGNYLITLPEGKAYSFNVNRKGYLFFSDNFFIQSSGRDTTFEKNIPLQSIEKDATITLKNIFFDFNQFDLKPASTTELDKLVELMTENPTLVTQVNGHTDNVGNANDNLKLSENRAKAVVNYLTGKGIDPHRLIAKGYGATQPIAGNDTEAGRAQNRRTDIKVLSQ
ncbi:MAG: OmpA family protein [Terrimonas sp.]|nr:OmpA family protein [Terrimonas sp.]